MLERSELMLKVTCLALAALVLFQCSRFVMRSDSLARLRIPALPSLPDNADAQTGGKTTNSPPRTGSQKPPTDLPPAMGARIERVTPATNLPPAISARIDRVTQSEMLGAIIRPLPMALLGIAGQDAFFRAPNGQTGLLKEGEELGGVKLLRIGTNRVLIEHEGQQKELSVFSGFGSETLLPKQKENPK
jgi:hypothetical protein